MKRYSSIIVVLAALTGMFVGCGGEHSAPDPVTDSKTAALGEAARLLQSVRGTSMGKGWESATLSGRATPIYRPDVEGPAYFEVGVRPAGYIVVSTGEHDYPIAQWSAAGQAPTHQLAARAKQKGKTIVRFYRLDALSYAGEDDQGRLVAHLGELPRQIDVSGVDAARAGDVIESVWTPQVDSNKNVIGGQIVSRALGDQGPREVLGLERFSAGKFSTVKAFSPSFNARPTGEWSELKAAYSKRFSRQLRALSVKAGEAWRSRASSSVRPALSASDEGIASQTMALHPVTNWSVVSAEGYEGAQRRYKQIAPWTGPNNNSCYSGCGATAWAMMFGWADYLAWNQSPVWSSHWGIFRFYGGYGADAPAPEYQNQGVDAMTMELRARLGTICLTNQGFTWHHNMHLAAYYLAGRDYSGIRTAYNIFAIPDTNLLQAAMNILITSRAVIIGIGSGTSLHYVLAYAFAYRHMSDGSTEIIFNVNWGDGNGASNNIWIPGSTWFVGELVP